MIHYYQVIAQAIKEMGLNGDENKYIKQLSGGTKRKLSTALTLLGNPLLVLLDEPTTLVHQIFQFSVF